MDSRIKHGYDEKFGINPHLKKSKNLILRNSGCGISMNVDIEVVPFVYFAKTITRGIAFIETDI